MVKKRILFIITQSEFGGAQRFLFNLIPRLKREAYDLLVASGNDGDGQFSLALKENKIPGQTLSHLRREVSLFQDILSIWQIRNLIKKYQPDVLFLNSSKAGFIGSLASVFPYHLKKVRVIYRIGGWSFNDPGPGWQKLLWKILEKISSGWKDFIIVNNKYDFNQAYRLKIRPREKLSLIYNGLDVYKMDFLPREEARLRIFEKISKSWGQIFQVENLVGTIANFYPTKGLEYLIQSAEDFRNDKQTAFVVIGDGNEREKLESLIKEKGLDKKVFLIGRIPNAFKFLTGLDIFLLPSVKEGFPWSLLEAMSAKLPVIATNVGAVPEIIEDHKNGLLVKPRDPVGLADKIKEVLENDHLKNELGIQAHQTVLFKFELNKMVKQIEDLL